MNNRLIAAAFAAALASGAAGAATITFEDASMPNEQAYAGPGGGRYWAGAVPPPLGSIAASFTSGGAAFANQRTDWGGGFASWSGFAYADTVDTTTAAFSNEFSAYAGGGAGGSANYGVGYVSNYDAAPRIDFAAPLELAGASFTNTTYAALSMLNGDGFAKRFGGTSGDDADWLKLSVTGLDAQDAVTGTVDVYLADYRFADNSLDYVLDDWRYVSLGSLGTVSALTFSMSSSDVGAFGINTPTYFAIDDIVAAAATPVPLPAVPLLLVPACGWVLTRRRSRHRR